ncbi:MAG: ComF family protein [Lachnospiraceae bacterium]|nr:ComF family protein [Lachnospiraceae bacterium]
MNFEGLKKTGNILLDFIFPRRCPYCDGIVTPLGEKIHAQCIEKLKLLTPPYCMKCGKKLMLNTDSKYCEQCMEGGHRFIRGRCLYDYKSVAPSIYRFKYGGRAEYAQYYGEETAEYLGEFIKKISPDALIPIPIHRRRYAKRGYNQAYLFAKEISKHTGIPVMDKVLHRKRNTVPLKMLSPKERQKNLKNAFIVGQNSVKLKTIILIDDIYTTGATMDEAARALQTSGIPDVYFVALAGGKGI